MIKFFSKKEEQRIIAAIREAESQTSGEIRVHLEREIIGDVQGVGFRIFHELEMDKTADRNGVLIFLVPDIRRFAIIGDEGINRVVPPHFWEDVRDLMQRHFRQGDFVTGVCEGIKLAGQKLKDHFPHAGDDDVNELPDEISYGRKS